MSSGREAVGLGVLGNGGSGVFLMKSAQGVRGCASFFVSFSSRTFLVGDQLANFTYKALFVIWVVTVGAFALVQFEGCLKL